MMSESRQIFREAALERLSSPERLDSLIQVVRPSAWLAWAPLAAIVVAAFAWSVLGSVPITVSGRAILLQRGGLAEVSAAAAGPVTQVLVSVGDRVQKGQPVARIAQPALEERKREAVDRLADAQRQEAKLQALVDRGAELADASVAQQRATINDKIHAAAERIELLRERASAQETLLGQGLITRQTLLDTRSSLTSARLELQTLRGALRQLALTQLERQRQAEDELRRVQEQVGDARRAVADLAESLRLTTVVDSPYAGRVVEVKVSQGMLVSVGTPLVTLEPEHNGAARLEAVVYLSASDGKKVQRGMTVYLAPSTVRREEYGYLIGKVTFVSDYPASTQSMLLTLQNAALVHELSGAAAPIEVRARLLPGDGPSGFKWSSSGPPVTITAGTLAQAQIAVRRQRPIALIIPALGAGPDIR